MEKYVNVPGQGRIYRRNKVWYLDYWVDQVRIRERYGSNKQEALRELAARRTDIDRGARGAEKKEIVHFSDFAKDFLKIKESAHSYRSMKGYLKPMTKFFGETPLSKITPELVETYKQRRLKERIRCAQIANEPPKTRERQGSSVNRELAILKNIFTIAAKQRRFRGENPVKAISYMPEQSRDYVLSREEVSRLIEAAGETSGTLKSIVLIALNTGLRRGEILGLKWSQVNFEDGIVSFARTKSVKFHRVPMNPIVLSILSSIERKGEFVFPGRWGRGHLIDVKKEFSAARKKAGLPDLHFHDLRHCAGTYMATAGVPLTTVQQILGHRDIRTTTRYINPNDESRRKPVNALAALFYEPEKSTGVQGTGTSVAQTQTRQVISLEISNS